MNDTPGFESKLKETYSEQNNSNSAPTPTINEPNNSYPETHFNNNPAQPQRLENTASYEKQSYPIAQETNLLMNQSTTPSQTNEESLWTIERLQFTVTNCSFTTFLSLIAAAIIAYGSSPMRGSEVATLFAGQALGGLLIGFATSLVLWHKLKSGESMANSLGMSNLFTSIANIPIGIAIAVCMYIIFTDNSMPVRDLLVAPLRILGNFYWVPFALLPAAIVCWGLQTFLTNSFFANSVITQMSMPFSDLAPTRFSVKRSNTAARCDICHREDMFDNKIGFCRRCQRYTV